MNDILTQWDALGLAEAIRSRKVGAKEVLEAAVARAEQINESVNAIVHPMFDEARRTVNAGLPEGPLSGVPFLLKDLGANYAGVPTTNGSRFFRNHVPDRDSELVARYKRAGLVILGKTNTPEFAAAPTTEGQVFGPTRNPWNLRHSAGGSSGGSAAAIACGVVPVAHGGDAGGSIRIPASCCGLFGFKPSRGRTPAVPDYGELWNGLYIEHAISRSVRDNAALLDASSGLAPGDPYVAPTKKRAFLDEVSTPPGRLRVAVQKTPTSGAPVDPACTAAVDDAAKLLEDLGHHVEEAELRYDVEGTGGAFRLLIAANVAATVAEYAEALGREPTEGDLQAIPALLAEEGKQATAADVVRATWAIHRTGPAAAAFFQDYDVVLTPTVAAPPPMLGHIDPTSTDVEDFLAKVFGWIPFTPIANMAGLPAMSVPLRWSAEGLPIGVHFMAAYGADDTLYRLAGQLEQARPWWDRRPEI